MRHPASQALYAYWNEVRRDRLAPRRLEIQPARLGDFLLDSFILERADTAHFRFRIVGTRAAGRFGVDLKVHDFLSCWREGDRSLLDYHLAAVSELGRVGVFTIEADLACAPGAATGPSAGAFEMVVLPLVHTGDTIDRLLCLIVPLDADLAVKTAPGLRLLAAEAVWPDAQPHDPLCYADRQIPLDPQVRMARIVRQGRRQFRVYQGGRMAPGHESGKAP